MPRRDWWDLDESDDDTRDDSDELGIGDDEDIESEDADDEEADLEALTFFRLE